MASVTEEQLRNDPTIITKLRSWDPDSKVRSFEGKVGAVCHNGAYFITSPNMDHIWAPPPNEPVTYKQDIRRGAHDELLWPQPYIKMFGHYPCLRRRPADLPPTHPFYIAYYKLQDCDLEYTHEGALSGIGVLQPELIRKVLDFLAAHINPKRDEFKKSEGDNRTIIDVIYLAINQNVVHLAELPMTRRQIYFLFAELQRYLLEFIAAFEYFTIYLPRQEGRLPPAEKVEEAVIGAFVHRAEDAEAFFRSGLPVWLIRPAAYAGTVRVDELVELLHPSDFLCLDDASYRYSVQFRGDLSDPQRFLTFGRYTRSFLSYGNSFHYLESTASTSQIPVPRNVSQRPQPYRKPASKSQNEDPVSEFLPPAPLFWIRAITNMNTDPARKRYVQKAEAEGGYILPNPSLFVRTATSNKRNLYFSNWLQYQSLFLYRLTTPGGQSPLSSQLWRDILNTSPQSDTSPPSGSVSDASSTKVQKRRELLTSVLSQSNLTDNGLDIRDSSPNISWNGQILTYGQNFEVPIGREILWELSELNFRFDLISLDRHLYRPSLDPDHASHCHSSSEDRLLLCLPKGAMSCLMLANLEDAGTGLASTDWQIRRPCTVGLRIVMRSWHGFLEMAEKDRELMRKSTEILRCIEENYIPFEKSLTAVYVQLFFDSFGRAPCLPRGL